MSRQKRAFLWWICLLLEREGGRWEYYARQGYEVTSVFEDRELSGDDADRPGLWQAVESLRRGWVLVAFKADRLARSVYRDELIRRTAAKHGARVEIVVGGTNGDAPEDAFKRQVLAAFVELERETIAARTKAAMQRHQKNGRRIRIRESEGRTIKTSAGVRTFPINDELAEILAAIMPTKGFVLGTKDGNPRKNNLLREFRVHMRKALLSLGHPGSDATNELKRLDIHSLRYTFITELIDSGVNPKAVQQLAGHKDIQMTLGIYAQCRQGSIDLAIAQLPWSLKSNVPKYQ